jgi:AraC family transcriptional regulator, regulatory protein of adaptative response / methylated-DNA-[protein]-cysteine methyltransferase
MKQDITNNYQLSFKEKYNAILDKNSEYEGVFFTCVKTTGIFCRPTCNARKPKQENVEFFPTIKEALLNGYRPCKVCKPLELSGTAPSHIQHLLDLFNKNPYKKITQFQIKQIGINPNTVRRWFKSNYGVTFSGYQRMIRLNTAFNHLANGNSVTETAFDNGFESLSGFSDAYKNLIGVNPSDSFKTNIINIHRITTPIGPMLAGATDKGLCLLEFTDRRMLEFELSELKRLLKANIIFGANKIFESLEKQLSEYFSGSRKSFDIQLNTPGTEFQNVVWKKLGEIPYGKTVSYKMQAVKIGNPSAVRAVAKANGFNRISIIIPCHRVIGENGNLTGYGGGIWRKKWLLDFEKKNTDFTE